MNASPLMILAFGFLLAAPANTVSPLDYTRSVLEQATKIVAGDQTHDQKLAGLSSLFGKFLDTDAMGREALGDHWSSFTPAQQKEFLVLFRNLIQRAYIQDLLLFQNPNFVYAGQQPTPAGTIVDTKIVTSKDKFDIKYTLVPAGGQWVAITVTVEGVNLIQNYANQINRVLDRTSPDGLLDIMRRKFGNTSGAS
jgi:phospholipid transport system substrate-binding protein